MDKLLQKDISAITNRLKDKYHPEKIILFGSAGRGDVKPGSDIDFFIVKNSQKPRHRRIVDVFRLLRDIDREYAVDFIIFTPRELKQRLRLGDFFVKNIIEEGEVLYESK